MTDVATIDSPNQRTLFVRLSPELHDQFKLSAAAEDKTLTAWAIEHLTAAAARASKPAVPEGREALFQPRRCPDCRNLVDVWPCLKCHPEDPS